MSKPGSMEYDYSPLRSSCPRCGAMTEEACMPIKPGPHPTILGYHPERGTSPGHLEREGYVHYVLVDPESPGSRLNLWRRHRQQPVEREGWVAVAGLTVEEIRDPQDPDKILYWRWDRNGKHLCAVTHKREGWRAIAYRRDGDQLVTELGYHDTHDQADAAIRDWAAQNPETTR